MARGKPAVTRPAKDQVSLLEIVRVRRQEIENDHSPQMQGQHWDETAWMPTPQARVPFANQTIGRFLGGRNEWAQLAMLEDWLRSSVGMPSHIDRLLTGAFDVRLHRSENLANAQKALFFVLGLLIGVLVGLVAGYMMGRMVLG
jgi:hypothetical protein